MYLLASEGDAIWLETWPDEGPLGIPAKKRLHRVKASAGKVLHDVALLGATMDGDAVVAAIEGTEELAERVRVLRVDRSGRVAGSARSPAPRDDASPVRRWRLTRGGKVAWFRIRDGTFQAFETELPRGR